jgi:amino acid transporter
MANQGTFKRKLNLVDMTFIGVGSIVGSGWLFASLLASQVAGPAAWISWVIGAVASYILGMVFAELGAALPRAGGLVRYPAYSHGPLTGYLVSFMAFVAYSCVAGLEAEGMRTYASAWWPALGTQNPTVLGWFVQAATLVLFFLLNYWSVNIFGKSNTVITLVKFVVPTLAIVVFLTQFKPTNFSLHGFAPFGLNGIEAAVSTTGIIFAFQGFQQPVLFASEAKKPSRTVPLSILFSLLVTMVIYVLLQVSFVGALPASLLHHGWGGVKLDSPFANLATLLGLGWLASVILTDAVLSPSGTANIYLSATARLIFGWSKNGTFFRVFTKLDSKTGVPRAALWFSLILAIFWTLPFPSWDKLVAVASSSGVLCFVMGPVAAAALRRSAPHLERPFRLRGMSVVAPIAFVIASLIVYWTGWQTDSWLIGSLLVMFILYCVFHKKAPDVGVSFSEQIKTTGWLILYSIAMIVLSYVGTFGGGKAIVPAPWDQVIVAVVSLVTYYWGVKSALRTPILDTEPSEVPDASVSPQVG